MSKSIKNTKFLTHLTKSGGGSYITIRKSICNKLNIKNDDVLLIKIEKIYSANENLHLSYKNPLSIIYVRSKNNHKSKQLLKSKQEKKLLEQNKEETTLKEEIKDENKSEQEVKQ